jgi:hydrogenase maturation protease
MSSLSSEASAAASHLGLPGRTAVEPAKTLVLGLGSPLRADDGVGVVLIEALREGGGFGEEVELVDGGSAGLEIVLLLEGRSRVVVVDAADMGLEPGAWRRFTPDEIAPADGTALKGTLHDAGLLEALALAEALGVLPEELVIFGVQPRSLDWEQGLTPPVRQALPALCEAVRRELGGG